MPSIPERPDFVKNIADVMNRQEGDNLPVSAFVGRENGEFPQGTAAYEKRGVAVEVPEWQPDSCIQCNQCAFACPHAVIRPFLLDDKEVKKAPNGFVTKDAKGKGLEGLKYRIQISPLDCTGCGVCVDVCPTPNKSLIMKPLEDQEKEIPNWDFVVKEVSDKSDRIPLDTIKGSQFARPLLEFSGACPGCGETPYAKLVTQLFGDRMIIANATGCSSIWGASAPSTPYTTNAEGSGPAWANSLFEDNAEYALGMELAVKYERNRLSDLMNEMVTLNVPQEIKDPFLEWLAGKNDAKSSKSATLKILKVLDRQLSDKRAMEILKAIKDRRDVLIKKSIWAFGGDGWAYDIDYGGLDHVLASNEDVNVLVFDTEVYSNTGGQASKSTPEAAVAQFAASGKRTSKKDLGRMAMAYGYVYVAQVAMGANMNQTLKAFLEAESYPGPSLIIAYSPCINHGIKAGMGKMADQEKHAVEAGYWHLYRYNPLLRKDGKNPFVLDSKEPKASFEDFLMSEVRYSSLKITFPEVADQLFKIAAEDAKQRYETYKKLSEG